MYKDGSLGSFDMRSLGPGNFVEMISYSEQQSDETPLSPYTNSRVLILPPAISPLFTSTSQMPARQGGDLQVLYSSSPTIWLENRTDQIVPLDLAAWTSFVTGLDLDATLHSLHERNFSAIVLRKDRVLHSQFFGTFFWNIFFTEIYLNNTPLLKLSYDNERFSIYSFVEDTVPITSFYSDSLPVFTERVSLLWGDIYLPHSSEFVAVNAVHFYHVSLNANNIKFVPIRRLSAVPYILQMYFNGFLNQDLIATTIPMVTTSIDLSMYDGILVITHQTYIFFILVLFTTASTLIIFLMSWR